MGGVQCLGQSPKKNVFFTPSLTQFWLKIIQRCEMKTATWVQRNFFWGRGTFHRATNSSWKVFYKKNTSNKQRNKQQLKTSKKLKISKQTFSWEPAHLTQQLVSHSWVAVEQFSVQPGISNFLVFLNISEYFLIFLNIS